MRLELDRKRQIKLIAQYKSLLKKSKNLEQVAKMSSEQAKQELIKSLEEQARSEAKHIISDIENNTRKEATNPYY